MNADEIQARIDEQRLEADGWAAVLVAFTNGQFTKLQCPHCGRRDAFGYIVHEHGFTVQCGACRRFVHGSGGRPDWVTENFSSEDYVPVPTNDIM